MTETSRQAELEAALNYLQNQGGKYAIAWGHDEGREYTRNFSYVRSSIDVLIEAARLSPTSPSEQQVQAERMQRGIDYWRAEFSRIAKYSSHYSQAYRAACTYLSRAKELADTKGVWDCDFEPTEDFSKLSDGIAEFLEVAAAAEVDLELAAQTKAPSQGEQAREIGFDGLLSDLVDAVWDFDSGDCRACGNAERDRNIHERGCIVARVRAALEQPAPSTTPGEAEALEALDRIERLYHQFSPVGSIMERWCKDLAALRAALSRGTGQKQSKTPPTEEGWYWLYEDNEQATWQCVFVATTPSVPVVMFASGRRESLANIRGSWASLPAPPSPLAQEKS